MRVGPKVSGAAHFRLGVNYWPARAALRWWDHLDVDVLTTDFGRLAAAGFDSVRIFLTWEAFQPSPDRIDGSMLDRLVRIADVAATSRLAIMPTLFTGHMSGVNLIPPWALGDPDPTMRFRVIADRQVTDRRPRNWYSDRDVVDAQTRLAGATARALAGHPALWAWDLGNENSNCSIPPDAALADRWLAETTDAIRGADPDAAITVGLHMEDLETDRRLGPTQAARVCDFLSMHGYPIYAPFATSPTDDLLLGFLVAITRWLGDGAEVAFTEFGLATTPLATAPLATAPAGVSTPALVEEAAVADYTDRALRTIRSSGASAAMLWCANDYVPTVWSDAPFDTAVHERHFGLWRHDGSPKPAVGVIRSHHGELVAPTPGGLDRWLDIEPTEFFTANGSHLARLYARYRAALR